MYITGTIQNVSKVYCYRSALDRSASQKALVVDDGTSHRTKEHSRGHAHGAGSPCPTAGRMFMCLYKNAINILLQIYFSL